MVAIRVNDDPPKGFESFVSGGSDIGGCSRGDTAQTANDSHPANTLSISRGDFEAACEGIDLCEDFKLNSAENLWMNVAARLLYSKPGFQQLNHYQQIAAVLDLKEKLEDMFKETKFSGLLGGNAYGNNNGFCATYDISWWPTKGELLPPVIDLLLPKNTLEEVLEFAGTAIPTVSEKPKTISLDSGKSKKITLTLNPAATPKGTIVPLPQALGIEISENITIGKPKIERQENGSVKITVEITADKKVLEKKTYGLRIMDTSQASPYVLAVVKKAVTLNPTECKTEEDQPPVAPDPLDYMFPAVESLPLLLSITPERAENFKQQVIRVRGLIQEHSTIVVYDREGREISSQLEIRGPKIKGKEENYFKIQFPRAFTPGKYTIIVSTVTHEPRESIIVLDQDNNAITLQGQPKLAVECGQAIFVLKEKKSEPPETEKKAEIKTEDPAAAERKRKAKDKARALAYCKKLAPKDREPCKKAVEGGMSYAKAKKTWKIPEKELNAEQKALIDKQKALGACKELSAPFDAACRDRVKNQGWTHSQVQEEYGN